MRTVIKNCILLDGTQDMQPKENTDIAIENGVITAIGKIDAEKDDKTVNLSGRYLMPGLINLHTHLPANGRPQKKPLKATLLATLVMSNPIGRRLALKICAANALTALNAGVTTVRAVGGLGHTDSMLRDRINAGKTDGPRLLVADYAIGVENGHMVGSVAKAAHSDEEAARMVEELCDNGVDLIKLMITGGVMDAKVKGEPGVLMMPPSMIKAAADAAHRRGKKVAAHIQSTEGIRAALQNGVDCVEHGSVLAQEEIDLFRRNNAAFVVTFSPAMPMSFFERETLGISEEVQYNSRLVYNNMVKGADAALKNGIPVGLGTDVGCPYTTPYNMWRELRYFQRELDLPAAFVLYTATLQNARIAGIDDITGSIEVGKSADFVVTNDDPLKDWRTLASPYAVSVRGKTVFEPKIKKYPLCERELDKYY